MCTVVLDTAMESVERVHYVHKMVIIDNIGRPQTTVYTLPRKISQYTISIKHDESMFYSISHILFLLIIMTIIFIMFFNTCTHWVRCMYCYGNYRRNKNTEIIVDHVTYLWKCSFINFPGEKHKQLGSIRTETAEKKPIWVWHSYLGIKSWN